MKIEITDEQMQRIDAVSLASQAQKLGKIKAEDLVFSVLQRCYPKSVSVQIQVSKSTADAVRSSKILYPEGLQTWCDRLGPFVCAIHRYHKTWGESQPLSHDGPSVAPAVLKDAAGPQEAVTVELATSLVESLLMIEQRFTVTVQGFLVSACVSVANEIQARALSASEYRPGGRCVSRNQRAAQMVRRS